MVEETDDDDEDEGDDDSRSFCTKETVHSTLSPSGKSLQWSANAWERRVFMLFTAARVRVLLSSVENRTVEEVAEDDEGDDEEEEEDEEEEVPSLPSCLLNVKCRRYGASSRG